MFKLAREREVLWPVTVNVPQDGGTVKKVDVRLRYKLACRSDEGFKLGADQADALAERITGWEAVANEDGTAAPFTNENLRAALDIPYFFQAALEGFVQASTGAEKKTSKPTSGGR